MDIIFPLIIPSLEFYTVIWNLPQTHLIHKLEKVQRSFLHFYAQKIKLFNHNIYRVASFSDLKSLETKRLVFDFTFVHKNTNSDIKFPEFYKQFI